MTSEYLAMQFTGERMVPEGADKATFWGHIYRYRFATRFVEGKRVLDIACGAGYGSAALLKSGARSVLGIDISQEACDFARSRYAVDAIVGNAEAIPCLDRSIDVIISFETIEHLGRPQSFLGECARILAPHGLLIISTPNREIYNRGRPRNPFHTVEFDKPEFISLLKPYFPNLTFYTQMPVFVSPWSIRSLAALSTSWVNIRGFWRLRDVLRKRTCPHLWSELNEAIRASAVEQILAGDYPFSSLVDPYGVHRSGSVFHEEPIYYIAIARV